MRRMVVAAIAAGLLAFLLALMARMMGVHEVLGSVRGKGRYI